MTSENKMSYTDSLTEIRKNRVKKKLAKKYYTKEELDGIFDRWTKELTKIWEAIHDLLEALHIVARDVRELQEAKTSIIKKKSQNNDDKLSN
jgi:cell division septum initiation protein DivIVA